jgi:hypothetical protein
MPNAKFLLHLGTTKPTGYFSATSRIVFHISSFTLPASLWRHIHLSNRSSYSTTSPLIGGAISALSRSFKKSTNESSCSFGQHSGRIYCAHGPRQSAARINIRPSRRKLEVPYSQVGHRTLMHIIFNVSYHPILTFPAVVVKMLAKNHARKIERGYGWRISQLESTVLICPCNHI